MKDAEKILKGTVQIAREQNHEGPEEEALALLAECHAGH